MFLIEEDPQRQGITLADCVEKCDAELAEPAKPTPSMTFGRNTFDRLERELTRYRPLIAKLCKTHFKSREDREDLAANVRLAACKKWASFDENLGTFGTWIGSIVRSEASSMRKRMAKVPRTVSCESAIDSALSPEPQEDEMQEVQNRIEGIPTPYRRALTCVTILGMSCRETAALLGATESTVRTYVWRARRHLAAQTLGQTTN